jgi:hypothetical protein
MTKALCVDCGTDTLPTGWHRRAEYYSVHDEVWAAAGMQFEGFLCIGCLEVRVGRRLTRSDFHGRTSQRPTDERHAPTSRTHQSTTYG